MNKKLYSILVVLLIAVFTLTACGAKETVIPTEVPEVVEPQPLPWKKDPA